MPGIDWNAITLWPVPNVSDSLINSLFPYSISAPPQFTCGQQLSPLHASGTGAIVVALLHAPAQSSGQQWQYRWRQWTWPRRRPWRCRWLFVVLLVVSLGAAEIFVNRRLLRLFVVLVNIYGRCKSKGTSMEGGMERKEVLCYKDYFCSRLIKWGGDECGAVD